MMTASADIKAIQDLCAYFISSGMDLAALEKKIAITLSFQTTAHALQKKKWRTINAAKTQMYHEAVRTIGDAVTQELDQATAEIEKEKQAEFKRRWEKKLSPMAFYKILFRHKTDRLHLRAEIEFEQVNALFARKVRNMEAMAQREMDRIIAEMDGWIKAWGANEKIMFDKNIDLLIVKACGVLMKAPIENMKAEIKKVRAEFVRATELLLIESRKLLEMQVRSRIQAILIANRQVRKTTVLYYLPLDESGYRSSGERGSYIVPARLAPLDRQPFLGSNPSPFLSNPVSLSSIREKFARCAREHGPPFLVGAATGFFTRTIVTHITAGIGFKFAAAAAITTLPTVAVTLGSAMLLGAVTGGVSRLVVKRYFGKEKKWDRGTFYRGALSGACGGLLGAGLADLLQDSGFLHHLFSRVHNTVEHQDLVAPVHELRVVPTDPAPDTPISAVRPVLIPVAAEPDAAELKRLIDQPDTFGGLPSLKKAAEDALKHKDWKQLAARFADAGYLKSMKLHHYNRAIANLWQQAGKLVMSQNVTGPTARNIMAGVDFLNKNPALTLRFK